MHYWSKYADFFLFWFLIFSRIDALQMGQSYYRLSGTEVAIYGISKRNQLTTNKPQ